MLHLVNQAGSQHPQSKPLTPSLLLLLLLLLPPPLLPCNRA
jgi:hypothetical protein